MAFIVLLVCLCLERFSKANFLARFNWFETYVHKIHELTKYQTWTQSYGIPLLFVILPIVVPIATLYYANLHFMHQGVITFIIAAFLLFYCLGPRNIFHENQIHQSIFWQANEAVFAVVFWMALLGPIAALIYRLVERSAHIQVSYPPLAKTAHCVRAYLDWLPIRVFSVLYALAGNFVKTSQFFLDHFVKEPSFNRELIERSGLIALGLEETVELTSEDYRSALRLIERSLILFLVFVLALTLGLLL